MLTYKIEHGSIYAYCNDRVINMGQVLHCLVAEDRLIVHGFDKDRIEHTKNLLHYLYENITHLQLHADWPEDNVKQGLRIVNEAIKGKGWSCE